MPASQPPSPGPLLSFDVEEYFQVEAAAEGGLRPERWGDWPCRLAPAVDRVLEVLDQCGCTATFFVLGWVARNEGELVRRIADAGHEIASHGMTHSMLHRLDAASFAAELNDSRRLLEDLSGRPVVGFRAPTFSITRRTAWALDVLAECGYRYDSSVFPVRHDRYGVPDAPRWAHWATGPVGGRVLELPPLTLRVFGANLPVGGGGYLRLLPLGVLNAAIRRAQRGDHAAMIYLHPWELDAGQPATPMGRVSRWRHRVNLARTADKLSRLCRRHAFTAIAPRLDDLQSQARETFQYGLVVTP